MIPAASSVVFPLSLAGASRLADAAASEIVFAATGDISNSVNRWFRRSGSFSENGILFAIVLAIGSLWVGLYLWDRYYKPNRRISLDREGLFAQLCDLHKLSRSDRQLLRNAAKHLRLDQPALAFVNPQILLDWAESSPDVTLEVRELVDRLFGESLIQEIVDQSIAAQRSP